MKLGKKLLALFAALAIMATIIVSGTAALAEGTEIVPDVTLSENDPFNYHDNDGLLDPKDIPTAQDVKSGKAGPGKKAPKNDNFKADASITLAKKEAPTYDQSIVTFQKTTHSGNTTTDVRLDVGNVNATASADAGVSVKDGMRVQVNAEASVAAAKATGSAEYNGGNYSGKATGSVAVGVARAKGNAKAHIGPNGAELEAKISAEANLAEAKGTVSGSAAGVEVKATGTLTVGVGAKAGATLKDGKIKIEAGASLGVGGSFTVEVDASKAMKTLEKYKREVENSGTNKTIDPSIPHDITDDIRKNSTELPGHGDPLLPINNLPNLGTDILNKLL